MLMPVLQWIFFVLHLSTDLLAAISPLYMLWQYLVLMPSPVLFS